MFTTIICDKRIINDCKDKYYSFLKPLDSGNFTFLEWNVNGKNIYDAVPGLKEVSEKHKEWQALIINSIETSDYDFINCKSENPLDIYGQLNTENKKLTDIEKISDVFDYVNNSNKIYDKLVNNPIVRLTNWLSNPLFITNGDIKEQKIDEKLITEELDKQIQENCYRDEKGLFKEGKCLLMEKAASLSVNHRDVVLKNTFSNSNFVIENSPKQIIVLSERVQDEYKDEQDKKLSKIDEYQNFSENNLYPLNTRLMLYDCLFGKKQERLESDRLGFYTFVYIFSNYQHPNDSLKQNRVYNVNIKLDEKALNNKCDGYIKRLLATEKHLKKLIGEEKFLANQKISDDLAIKLFESNEYITCKINSRYSSDDLMCEHSELGFTKDFPIKEAKYWNDQYEEIEDAFTRYMREPARAVKNAVTDEMPIKKVFYDDHIADLNEYQQENVGYKLDEEKDALSKVDVHSIPDVNDYRKRLDEKDNQINERIEQRMNLKQVIFSTSIILSLFLIGSIPFIVSSFYDENGRILSPFIALTALGVLFLTLVICIIVFRIQIVNMFKSFNLLIKDVLKEINENLLLYSDYISKSTNVMRLNSIMSMFGKGRKNNIRTYEKHIKEIDDIVDYTYAMLHDYLSPKNDIKVDDTEDKYEFDYTKNEPATYDMPIIEGNSEIKYLENGNIINVPIDYVSEINLELEEMYGQYY